MPNLQPPPSNRPVAETRQDPAFPVRGARGRATRVELLRRLCASLKSIFERGHVLGMPFVKAKLDCALRIPSLSLTQAPRWG